MADFEQQVQQLMSVTGCADQAFCAELLLQNSFDVGFYHISARFAAATHATHVRIPAVDAGDEHQKLTTCTAAGASAAPPPAVVTPSANGSSAEGGGPNSRSSRNSRPQDLPRAAGHPSADDSGGGGGGVCR
eukprot:gene11535-25432_t